jgi:hypothetical protein
MPPLNGVTGAEKGFVDIRGHLSAHREQRL